MVDTIDARISDLFYPLCSPGFVLPAIAGLALRSCLYS